VRATEPIFSVVIPCYNGAATLEPCLESLLAERDELREVILVDDGSTDASVDIAGRFDCQVIRHSQNRGSAAARNTGAAAASGEVIIFLDTDVLTPPGTLARLRARLEAAPELDAVNATYTWAYTPDSRFGQFFNALMYVEMHECPIAIVTSFCAIRRAAFDACGGFDERIDRACADDITFGWVFLNRGLHSRQFDDVECAHLKTLTARQWASHSYNHGLYWTRSFFENIEETSRLREHAVTSGFRAWNILLIIGLGPALMSPVPRPLVYAAFGGAFYWNNRLILKTFREREGTRFALFGAAALAGESVFYLAGASRGLLSAPRLLSRRVRRRVGQAALARSE
jgi:glycosyltransferase involved in cell wall biosynthesis